MNAAKELNNGKSMSVWVYAAGIALPLIVGIVSALLTRGNMDIYEQVKTPPLSPPSILFPIVWTALYVLMGVSSLLVLYNAGKAPAEAKTGLIFYGISLIFNFFWSILFFNLRAFLFSFIWLIALLVLIVLTVVNYAKVNKIAACLQIPYALWVAFAGYLNAGIWILNK